MGSQQEMFGGLFGKKKSANERLRESKRQLDRKIRELDRERQQIERSEAKVKEDIKRYAQRGETEVARRLARDVVRSQAEKKKFLTMRSQLQGIQMRMQTLKSQEAMNQAIQGVTRVMNQMSAGMPNNQLHRVMNDFEYSLQRMDHRAEMMDEALDGTQEVENEEEESEELVNKVLDEIGVASSTGLASAPGSKAKSSADAQSNSQSQAQPQQEEPAEDDPDLQARLDNLRRS